jgi:hypothetical protein
MNVHTFSTIFDILSLVVIAFGVGFCANGSWHKNWRGLWAAGVVLVLAKSDSGT